MKKLEGYVAEVMKEIINEEESVYEIKGKRYHVNFMEEPSTTVKDDIKADPELQQKLHQAKQNIRNGSVYTTDDVLEMIEQGKIDWPKKFKS